MTPTHRFILAGCLIALAIATFVGYQIGTFFNSGTTGAWAGFGLSMGWIVYKAIQPMLDNLALEEAACE